MAPPEVETENILNHQFEDIQLGSTNRIIDIDADSIPPKIFLDLVGITCYTLPLNLFLDEMGYNSNYPCHQCRIYISCASRDGSKQTDADCSGLNSEYRSMVL